MKNIILSGSMQFLDEMRKLAHPLKDKGFIPVLPEEDDWTSIKPENINAYKKMVSRKHLDAIASPDTYGILVVNYPKKGLNNYIGANTFAEIAVAFYFNKRIYLLNDIYEPYSDELLGWDAMPLKGNIEDLI